MEEQALIQLQEQYEQMLRLRKDSSLLTGYTLHTIAGDIHITNQQRALSMLDFIIKELKTEIKNETSSTLKK